MLVISRRDRESILIGDNIRVTVYGPGVVRLGIEAPRDVKVLRDNAKQTTPRHSPG